VVRSPWDLAEERRKGSDCVALLLKAARRRGSRSGHRSRIRYLSKKKFANFNEFSEIKKIRKNSYENSLNARGNSNTAR